MKRFVPLVSFLAATLAAGALPALALDAGDAAFRRGDYGSAAKHWQQAAQGGDRRAQWLVGWLHDRGDRGLPKDRAEANRWYRKAIQGDAPGAVWNRGLAAAWGKAGATRSLRSAESLYRRAAERGGPEMQARLGRCYQGEALPACGLRRDFAQAKRWFEKAAAQSVAAGYCGLADLYAAGQGVVRSARTAQDYEAQAQAAGAPCGQVAPGAIAAVRPEPVPLTAEQVRQRALVAEVQRELARLGFAPGPVDGQMGQRTRRAIFDFQTRSGLSADGAPSGELLAQLLSADPAALGDIIASTTPQLDPSTNGLESLRIPDGAGHDFGRYKALVIGNAKYQELPALGTATRDADAVAAILRDGYGFDVELVKDATRAQLISRFAALRKELRPEDNLLVYYAGHGWYDEESERGYWLPIDAAEGDKANWISNGTLTDDLKAIQAKHVMVVADSCYSGTWTRALNLRNRSEDYLTQMARKRARVVLASGNLEPVSDRGGRGHSVFARAFLDALSQNDGVIDGTQLFAQIRRPVMLDSDQTPQYGDIRNAGHGGGDFLFIRRK